MTTATAAQDPVLLGMLQKGEDVLDFITEHSFTVFEPIARDIAKACFYAWLYGGGKKGVVRWMSQRLLHLTGTMHTHPMDTIAKLFPECAKFRRRQMQKAANGPLTLPWGHIRSIPKGPTQGPAAAAAVPQALGGAGLKEYLIECQKYPILLHSLAAVVHDEAVHGPFYTIEEAEECAATMIPAMKEGFGKVIDPSIPIRVSVEVQKQWTH